MEEELRIVWDKALLNSSDLIFSDVICAWTVWFLLWVVCWSFNCLFFMMSSFVLYLNVGIALSCKIQLIIWSRWFKCDIFSRPLNLLMPDSLNCCLFLEDWGFYECQRTWGKYIAIGSWFLTVLDKHPYSIVISFLSLYGFFGASYTVNSWRQWFNNRHQSIVVWESLPCWGASRCGWCFALGWVLLACFASTQIFCWR